MRASVVPTRCVPLALLLLLHSVKSERDVSDVCSACADVWLKINPPIAAPLMAIETGDTVIDGCRALGAVADESDENYLVRVALTDQTSCANYQRAASCFAAVNVTCAGCDMLGERFDHTSIEARAANLAIATACVMEERVEPSFCRGHSARSVEDMSLVAWRRLIAWRIDHCPTPETIEVPPSTAHTTLDKSDPLFKYSRQAEYERQQQAAGRPIARLSHECFYIGTTQDTCQPNEEGIFTDPRGCEGRVQRRAECPRG